MTRDTEFRDTHDRDDDGLQARLRALRDDRAPGRDLWPGIAAAIAADGIAARTPGPAAGDLPSAQVAAAATSPAAGAIAPSPFAGTSGRHHHRRPRRRAWVGWSAAASVALAVALGWSLRPDAPGAAVDVPSVAIAPSASGPAAPATAAAPGSGPAPVDPSSLPMLLRQADAMSREYAGALREVEASRGRASPDPALAGAAAELDRSAAAIRQALAQAPESRFLVERLQRVYAQRLALARHAAVA